MYAIYKLFKYLYKHILKEDGINKIIFCNLLRTSPSALWDPQVSILQSSATLPATLRSLPTCNRG